MLKGVHGIFCLCLLLIEADLYFEKKVPSFPSLLSSATKIGIALHSQKEERLGLLGHHWEKHKQPPNDTTQDVVRGPERWQKRRGSQQDNAGSAW